MIPITKNIIVLDEQGHEYEATYPKRAKGLVKNGRARFIDDNKICLACPPNDILEDKNMSDINLCEQKQSNENITAVNTSKTEFTQQTNEEKLTMNYVLEQIEKIAAQTDYLNSTIEKLGLMDNGDSAEAMSPGNTLGQAKAQALGDVVRCRETTNQQILRLYEKMYDDLKQTDKAQKIPNNNYTSHLQEVTNWFKTLNKEEFDPIGWAAITQALTAQLSRNY